MLRVIGERYRNHPKHRALMILSVYNYFYPKQADVGNISYSTNNTALPTEHISKFHPRLKTIFQQLDGLAPRFVVGRGSIRILTDPKDFYETLKEKIATAKKRVFLTTLYIGKRQYELMDCIAEAMEKNEDLKVYILVDALRGTRDAPTPCTASLVVELVERFGHHRIDFRAYQTPRLKGLARAWNPKRLNETWGVQHMKLYGFDEEIILTGANLSHDYFSDRQDRYYLFKSKAITDYYYELHNAIASLSYQVLPARKKQEGFKFDWPTSNASCEPHLNLDRFISDSSFLLEPLLKQSTLKAFDEYEDTNDFETVVYPISQFTPLFPANMDRSTELPAVLRILAFLDSPKIRWWFTAGYFNMLEQIQNRLIEGKATVSVITASPKANSFYKSSGLSYYIPELYLLCAKKFLETVKKCGKQNLITLYEWQKGVVNTLNGWSYHAKGIWSTVPGEDLPTLTVIGSSNYTKRAYLLDIESNAVIITRDPELKLEMKKEIDNIMKDVKPLELSHFDPKPQPLPEGNGEGEDEKAKEPIYAVDEDRRISRRVHLLHRFVGESL